MLGISKEHLDQWAQDIVTDRADLYCKELARERAEKENGLLAFFFGGNDKEKEKAKQ